MDGPVDLIIADMVAKKELDTYSAYPVIISQWSYDGSLGINWKNSDVNRKEHNYESEEDAITADELPALKAKWGRTRRTGCEFTRGRISGRLILCRSRMQPLGIFKGRYLEISVDYN